MEKEIDGTKRKRRKKSSARSILSGHSAGDTLFALMLASISKHRSNAAESILILTQCLNRLSLSLLSKSLDPFLSFFPLLLRSKCTEIAIRSLEIIGAASLYSLEMNQKIALDDQIVKGLIIVVGISKRKKNVALAACNAALDLSSTSIGRRRLLQFSALEYFIFQFNQVPKRSGPEVCLYTEETGNSNANCARIGLKEDEYLILLLDVAITLVNTCTVEQLEKIPRRFSESLLLYLKILWAEIHMQMLLGNILESRSITQFYLSKIKPNTLAEGIFRLSINGMQLLTASNCEEVKRSIFDSRKTTFESFMLNYWEVSPLHIRRHPKSITNIFSSLKETLRPAGVFPSFLSEMLQKSTSSLPIYSDELDILNFLDCVRDHLGCPIIYQHDIRVVKTQNLDREMHFFPEHLGSCFPQDPHILYINDILKCEEAFKEGYSIAMRGMEFRFESIAAIADGLASLFGQPSGGVNMYLTPLHSQGLACHYDDHCVFVCQIIGVKKWKMFPRLSLQLPRLYEPVNKLENGGMKMDECTQVLLREGDVLYIPRGVPHEACTVVDNEGPDRNACFSLHLTLAIEVEPPFEWEGFTHVALHHWGRNQYLSKYPSADALSLNLSVLAVNLLHIAIKKIATADATFRKACLVGAMLSPSVTEGWLDVDQRTTFSYLLSTVNTKSRFEDAVRGIEVALQNHEDPLQEIRWLKHLNREGEMFEGQKWDSPSIEAETFSYLVGQNLDKAKVAFMHAKSKFCNEVIVENVVDSYKMLLEKYRIARNHYMNGMFSLHCN